jgi:hypothetical protein
LVSLQIIYVPCCTQTSGLLESDLFLPSDWWAGEKCVLCYAVQHVNRSPFRGHQPQAFHCKFCVFHKSRRIEANEALFSSHSCLNQSSGPEKSHGLKVECNYIVGRTVVCAPCFTTNRSLSGIEPRWIASFSSLFSVVRPDTEHSIFAVSSVGFISSE